MFQMLIYGYAVFWLTSVTTLETESDVEVRLLDNQNSPLMATFDMSKANVRIKQFVSDTIEGKMKDIEELWKRKECMSDALEVKIKDIEAKNTKDTKLRPKGCEDVIQKRSNGIYTIYPVSNNNGFEVYCDFKTDNGNWTVFQKRINGTTDFFRGWEEYENGFGNLEAEFWLGNRKISDITSTGKYELRIDLTDFDGITGFAKYSTFSVGNASTNYILTVRGYNGNIGNGLWYNSGMSFTTKDRDNDRDSTVNCANTRNGAWWYNRCNNVNLNGQYLQRWKYDINGITWYEWKTSFHPMKSSVMMFRKVY
ncbi:Tenascin-R,Ryncolin-2,Ficolin-1-A,Ryncolin-1,Fibrinogen C domain-containing protein 1,Tenascin-N,Fibroleukin,Fibrinogen-like protein 1,Ficolin-2,Tenascin,Ficolin-1,Fibrinogen-like protein A,Ficolin-1-B,Microfibril-associated glycoprotein 4,Ryncolin-3,Ryncolin-4 [Mytilus edulis]|uniref:Fibrinogen C-terminal domain-containing protein n=1 Tax=Mytilus edulis TaxID=6550 RepID=A0A8S3SMB9_MYTED|nr:Tenascin-R,Ryncolin-2,Ficolin-1-A,Ryncolin-1,Fibrinogen C domain-containing protein 1,Tenascin-N,Fibroleukin,Fibrinogen-like protein 1,Ficolin-2,Tenascin,Ficolin-1,Fibrinogen-like protein A,Ficolin-1-B,Microfibril-associated glycoprotein 4,Ryncolin-3,Ryncolin-4 [Mytilus edulis]